jgi:hypothetical protein
MPLSDDEAVAEATRLRERLMLERQRLDPVRRYWTGRQGLPLVIPRNAPVEVREMGRVASGINIAGIVVETLEQSLFVDGFRGPREEDNAEVWNVWQANRLDARQGGIHRPALAYGVAFAVIWPAEIIPPELRISGAEDDPVIRGQTPRLLTADYDIRQPKWPKVALEKVGKDEWWLYDAEAIYTLSYTGDRFDHIDTKEHGLAVTPVIRYLEVEDPDAEDEAIEDRISTRKQYEPRLVSGQVAPLMALQDQISLVTFNLLIAQHYGAFRQRYVIGWTGATEDNAIKMAASRLQVFKDAVGDIEVGEWGQTDLSGYITSRESTLKYAATLSQTPVHELIGELVNLSAEALAAAEAGRDRKVDARQTMFGESHEQLMGLVADITGSEVPANAEAIWRDTSARSLAATVDALGKLATMLGVPTEALWERVPGATKNEIDRWKALAARGDALGGLAQILDQQSMTPAAAEAADIKAKADAMGVLIRAGVDQESAARQVGLDVSFVPGAVSTSIRLEGNGAGVPV